MNRLRTKDEQDLLEDIIKSRERGPPFWPRRDWDYTEWEETMDEYNSKKERLNVRD